ncbi:MAG: hypothetical protein ACPGC5_04440 [Flavobacteriaceae bacterium]
MKLLHRIGYYLFGLSIGLVFVAFFLSGKKTSCNYGPQARVLADFEKKQFVINPQIKIQNTLIDSLQFSIMLERATVDFSKSETRLDSCKRYHIDSYFRQQAYEITVENCTKEIKIVTLRPKP